MRKIDAQKRMEIIEHALELMRTKGHDYCGIQRETDWAANFEFAAQFASLIQQKPITANDVLAVMLGNKMARRAALKTVDVPLYESFADTASDGVNYLTFLFSMDIEEQEGGQ